MPGRTIFQSQSPVSQSVEAVRSMLAAFGKPVEPMPEFYRMSSSVVLVLSAKKDCYYTTTKRGCSCPAAAYRPGKTCKHQRKYLGMEPTPSRIPTLSGKGFKPILEAA